MTAPPTIRRCRSRFRPFAAVGLAALGGALGCGQDQGLVLVDVRAEPDVLPAERLLLQAGNEKGIWATAEFPGDLPRGSEPRRLGVYVPEGLSGSVIALVSALDAKKCEVGRGGATGMLPKAGTVRIEVLVRRTVTCGPPPDAGVADARPDAAADGPARDTAPGGPPIDARPADAAAGDVAMADRPETGVDAADAPPEGPPLPPPPDARAPADLPAPPPPDAGVDVAPAPDAPPGDAAGLADTAPAGDAAAPTDTASPADTAAPDAAAPDTPPAPPPDMAIADAAEDAAGADAPEDTQAPVDAQAVDAEDDADDDAPAPDAEVDAPGDAPAPPPDSEPDSAPDTPPDAPLPPIDSALAPDTAPPPDTGPAMCDEVAQVGCNTGLMCVFVCNPPPSYGGTTCLPQGTLPIGSDCSTTSQCAPGGHCIASMGNRRRCHKYCRTSADCPIATTTGLCQYRVYCTGEPPGSYNAYLCGLN